ncbi:TonB-dependent receptor [Novosphingobium sp. KN65.2]|uniref:TonB-dependent receptor n=1 Tax=Novosphingobium sp. KN65.2 TaxID=1478134 RepID=UPI000A62F94A|nr:TonB-dependent receptor [Novosphingobium sp. KN65.2]
MSGYIEGNAGNYDLIGGSAALNLPLSDSIAVRFAGKLSRRDGYLEDGYDDEKSQAGRVHLLFDPGKDVSLLLTGFYQHDGGKGSSFTLMHSDIGDPWAGPTQQAWRDIVLANTAPPGFLMTGALPRSDGFRDSTVYGVSAELNWDLGPATLTILPAYRFGKQANRFFVPNYEFVEYEQDKQSSVEVRLAHQGDGLKWVLGGYFFDERQANQSGKTLRFNQTGFSAADIPDYGSQTRSYAVFGQMTYSIADAFRLTGGLRYTYERKTQNGVNIDYRTPATLPPNLTCPSGYNLTATPPLPTTPCALSFNLADRDSYNSITWKAGFEYDVAPRSLLYGNASTGFKSGGFYAAPPPASFNAEKLTAFELGLKNRLLDNKLQLNLEAFYYNYRDHQEAYLGPTSLPGYFTLITANAGKAKSYGGMIDIVFQPTNADRLAVGVQYNKSRYDSFL